MKRALIAVAALAVVLASVPLLAIAARRGINDGNDTKMALDVHRVRISGGKPRWIITTWKPWSAQQIYDQGYLMVRLDTFGNKRSDYYVLIRATGNRLEATLFRDYERKNDHPITRVHVDRPDRRSVRVRVPLGKMRRRPVFYYWFVETLMTTNNCSRVCFDRAPNRGRVREPERAPTPTPTPTLTFTPSPSPTVSP